MLFLPYYNRQDDYEVMREAESKRQRERDHLTTSQNICYINQCGII